MATALEQGIVTTPQAIKQREMISELAPHLKPEEGVALPGKPKGATIKDVDYLNKLFASQDRLKLQPPAPVTIVNLNPFDLMVLHPLFDGLKVKANVSGQDFSALTIREVKYQVNPGLDMINTPEEFWPIQLAMEFERRYSEKGGVFCIQGDLERDASLSESSDFKVKYNTAESTMIDYCSKLKRQADNEWNTPNRAGARNIHATHRRAAQILLDRKLLREAPGWMDSIIRADEVLPTCVCGAEIKKGVVMCSTCTNIIDPMEAFKRGLIDENHMALERLTRAQVTDLGVSDYVAETTDERPARLAAKKPKPLSAFDLASQAPAPQDKPTPTPAGGRR